MADEKGSWAWLGRIEAIITLIGAIAAAVTGLLGYFGGISHGEAKQLTSTLDALDQLEKATPPNLKERMHPIYAEMRATATNSAVPQSSSEITKRASVIASATTGIPTSTFSIGTSRTFLLPDNKTALACDDRIHIALEARVGGYKTAPVIAVDGARIGTRPGFSTTFQNGMRLTVMQVEEQGVVLDVQCK